MLPYAFRFHGHSSLRYVFKNGETVRSRFLTLRYTRNTHRRQSRFSVSVSKKIYKSAFKRNRIRRRVYEVVRHMLPEFPGVYDVVFIVTGPELLTLDHETVRGAVLKALGEAGLSPASQP